MTVFLRLREELQTFGLSFPSGASRPCLNVFRGYVSARAAGLQGAPLCQQLRPRASERPPRACALLSVANDAIFLLTSGSAFPLRPPHSFMEILFVQLKTQKIFKHIM